MYFLEFLETCTIRWVWICEGGVGLFYFFGGWETDRAGLGSGYMPRRCTPTPSSAHGRATQHRQQHRPCQMQGRQRTGTHARTLDTLHWSALDTRQAAPGRSGRRRGWTACAVCPKLSRYGRLSGTPKQVQKSSLFCVCLLPVQLYKYIKKCYYNVSKSIH